MGQVLLEEHLVDLPGDREFGLELADPPLRGCELHLPLSAQPRRLTAVDALLLQPAIDHGLAHPERLGQLRDPRAHSRELHDLLTHLDSIPTGHCFLLAEHRRIPETQLR